MPLSKPSRCQQSIIGYPHSILLLILMTLGGSLESLAQESIPSHSARADARALSLAFREASKRAIPSVVTILTYGQPNSSSGRTAEPRDPGSDDEKPDEDESDDEGFGDPETSEDEETSPPTPEVDEKRLTGLGSGVIVSNDGMIITNNHVIRGAKRVVVQLADETEIEASSVQGDPDSDVAVVKIDVTPELESAIVGLEMADSSRVEIGDWVLAIGSPFRYEATVSAGIISAKGREVSRINRGRLIQTDAAINPGNSGGPLIDIDGNVVAINTAIATRSGGSQGIGFAIPINQARWIAGELAEHGKVRRAAIGVTTAPLIPRIARKFDLEPYIGILVYQIVDGSVAERAGLKPLDVITDFAEKPVRDAATFQRLIEQSPIGSKQKVSLLRDGETIELEIEIASLLDPTQAFDDAKE
ncbi:MAG: trypsin-like peptidase domain-containing protein [Planctomycetota bacterium]